MAVTNPLHRVKLIQAGYNPDEYDAYEPTPPPAPIQQEPKVENQQPTTGAIRSTLENAAFDIPSTGISLASGALGAKLLSSIPIPNPIAKGVLGLIGGVGGAVAGGKYSREAQDYLINKFAPEELAKRYNTDIETTRREHPIASRIGDLLASGIFMRPSTDVLKSAGRVFTKPPQGLTPSASEIGNLANVGIGAASPVINSLVAGQNPIQEAKEHPIETALEVLAGGALNSPTALAQRYLGLHPSVYEPTGEELGAARKNQIRTSEPILPKPREAIALLPERSGPTTTEDYTKPDQFNVNKVPAAAQNNIDVLNPTLSDIQQQLSDIPIEEAVAPKVDALNKTTIEPSSNEIKPSTIEGYKKYLIETRGKSPEEADNIINNLLPPPEPSPKDINYQQGQTDEQRVQPIVEGLKKQNLPTTPTVALNDLFKEFAKKRNITVDDSGRVFDSKGNEINGQAFFREGLNAALAKINPNKASIDTLPHELFHPFFRDMQTLGGIKSKAFINRIQRLVQGSPEFVDWAERRSNAGQGSSAEEYITQLTGEDSIRRLLNTDETGAIKNWFRDFWAYQKTRFGKGSPQDVARVMSNKLLNEPSFNEQFNPKGIRSNIVPSEQESKQQETSPFSPEEKAKGAKVQDEQERLLQEYQDLKNQIANTKNHQDLNNIYRQLDEVNNKLQQLNAPEPYKNQETSPFSKEDINKGKSFEQEQRKQQEATIKSIDERYDKRNAGELTKEVAEINAEKNLKRSDQSLGYRTNYELEQNQVTSPFASENDKIRKLGTPEAQALADANQKFYEDLKSFRGRFQGKPIEEIINKAGLNISDIVSGKGGLKSYGTQNSPLLDSLYDKMQDLKDGKQVTFTPEEQSIRSVVQGIMQDVRNNLRTRPGIRNIIRLPNNPNYIPHIINPDIPRTINSDRNSPESLRLQKELVDYQISKGLTAKEAQGNLDAILNAYNSKSVDTASQYGPLDKAEGIGIPKSWREPHLLTALQKYTDRAARRFAYFDAIQSNPKALAGLQRHGGEGSVKTVMNDIIGNTPRDTSTFSNTQGIARSLELGTLTGVRDILSNLTLGWQHQQNPIKAVQHGVQSLLNLKNNIADGVENGRIRHNINSLEWNDTVGALKRISDVISDATGRNFLERISRGYSTGIGELTTLDYLEQFNKGKLGKQGQDWFNNFGKDTNWKIGSLTREELLKIAGRFTDSSQGAYDYTGLPKYSKEGMLSPFFSLSRWNIEKANNYLKHVIEPMKRGNYTPLLMSTFGMFVSGALVNKVTSLFTGTKDKTASIDELNAAYQEGKPITSALAYKILGLASASGYAGIMSDLAKSVMDRQYAKVKPRWFNNLGLEALRSTTTSIGNLASAIADNGGMSPDIALEFTKDMILNNIQTSRLIFSHVGEEGPKQKEESNKIRDLRTFNLLQGNDVSDLTDSDYSKKYENLDIKNYKQEEDLGKATEMLPALLQKAIEKANGDPEKLKQELSKIKRNNYETMPNPKNMPISFQNYISYLTKTQGAEAASERLNDYLSRSMINKAKSSMVP